MTSRLCLSFFLLLFVFSGCSAAGSSARKIQKLEKYDLVLQSRAGGHSSGKSVTIKTEIARTDEERSTGLMYRDRLADGEGMLFVFDRDEVLTFWMKNTTIPLSIAFIASDGRIMEIRDMEPGNLDPVRSGRSVRYALEVPQGWFDRVDLGIGDRLVIN